MLDSPEGAVHLEKYASWPLDVLVGYVQLAEEKLLSLRIPLIKEKFSIICGLHRKVHPEIVGISDFFSEVAFGLTVELTRDAELVFPYLNNLFECQQSEIEGAIPEFSSVNNLMQLSLIAHNRALNDLSAIVRMTTTFNEFVLVDPVHDNLVGAVSILRSDLELIMQIKFGLLFPKAIETETNAAM